MNYEAASKINVKFADIRSNLEKLVEAGLMEKMVNVIGKTKISMIEIMFDVMDEIEQKGKLENVPEEIAQFYNGIVEQYNGFNEVKKAEVVKEEKAPKEEKAVKVKEEKVAKVKVVKSEKVKKEKAVKEVKEKKILFTTYGYRSNAQSAVIENYFINGANINDIIEKTGLSKQRIMAHFYDMKNVKKVNIIKEDNGFIKIIK